MPLNGHTMRSFHVLLSVVVCMSYCAFAEFAVDRSAMSEAYW